MLADAVAITCRRMHADDLEACMALKTSAGWNQLAADWVLLAGFDPQACFVALAGERLVGTCTAIDYDGRFSWIGMVLVHPDLRGRGIGSLLMQKVMEALSRCETVKLDATPAGRRLYLHLGFTDEYELARLVAARALWTDLLDPSAELRPLRPADLPAAVACDTPVFGADRGRVLQAWLRRTPEAAFGLWRQGRLAGYALGRPGAHFATIGPVIASGLADACRLAQAVGQSFGDAPVGLDSPARHGAFRDWLEQRGFTFQRPLTRMYRGPNRWPGQPERQWAVLGPEIG